MIDSSLGRRHLSFSMADQPQVTNVKCCFCQKTFPFDLARERGTDPSSSSNPLAKVLRGQAEVEGAAVTQQFYYSG